MSDFNNKTFPCIICHKVLENVLDDLKDNQPYNALEFVTRGHYGSTYFDPMNGDKLIVNICDDCVKKEVDEKRIVLIPYKKE